MGAVAAKLRCAYCSRPTPLGNVTHDGLPWCGCPGAADRTVAADVDRLACAHDRGWGREALTGRALCAGCGVELERVKPGEHRGASFWFEVVERLETCSWHGLAAVATVDDLIPPVAPFELGPHCPGYVGSALLRVAERDGPRQWTVSFDGIGRLWRVKGGVRA